MELDNTPSTVSRGDGAGDPLSIGLSMLVAMEWGGCDRKDVVSGS